MNREPFRVEVGDDPSDPVAGLIAEALGAHVAQAFGPPASHPLVIAIRRGARVVAGLSGIGHWNWLYIRQLWVDEAERSQGLGSRLLAQAEHEARQRNYRGLYIDTFDPAIAAFYGRRAFAVVGRIADFPPGHERIFLARHLGPHAPGPG